MMRQGRPDPQFDGFRRADESFKRVQAQLSTEMLAYEVDLSVGHTFSTNTFVDLPFAGNAFYVDQNSDVGNATIMFANQQTPGTIVPVYVQAGFIARVPFTRLMIANSAQSGKKLRFFYGVDIDFVPSINGTLSISGNISVLPALDSQGATLDRGFIYGASYKSVTALAANTPDTVFTPGSNANGAILWDAGYFHRDGGNGTAAFVAKTSAPASVIDGDVLLGASFNLVDPPSTNFQASGGLRRPVRIAAGKGLYFINTSLGLSGAQRHALYTLL